MIRESEKGVARRAAHGAISFFKRDGVLAFLLICLSLGWSLVAVSRGTQISRYDEWTYIDYARKVAVGHIPIQGEPLAAQSLEDWSCRGMEGGIRDVKPPECGSIYKGAPTTSWPFKGENYNAFHPPAYFFATGLGGQTISELTGVDFVTGARLVSAGFVALGVAGLFLAIRAWRVNRLAAFSGALLALTTPAVAASSAIVHNDAITLLAGDAAVWAGARIFTRHKLGWGVPAFLAFLVSSFRVVSLGAMLAVAGVVLLACFIPKVFGLLADDKQDLSRIFGATVGAAAVPYLFWNQFQGVRTPPGYIPAIDGLSTIKLKDSALHYVVPTLIDAYGLTDPRTDFYLQPGLKSGATFTWAGILYIFYIVLLIVSAICMWKAVDRRGLILSTAISPFVTALVVQVREIMTTSGYFDVVSGRYAMSTVALHCALAAVLCNGKRSKWLFLFAVAGCVFMAAGVAMAKVPQV